MTDAPFQQAVDDAREQVALAWRAIGDTGVGGSEESLRAIAHALLAIEAHLREIARQA